MFSIETLTDYLFFCQSLIFPPPAITSITSIGTVNTLTQVTPMEALLAVAARWHNHMSQDARALSMTFNIHTTHGDDLSHNHQWTDLNARNINIYPVYMSSIERAMAEVGRLMCMYFMRLLVCVRG